MNRLTMRSKVDAEGVLHVTVNVGPADANRQVQVTIEPVDQAPRWTQEEWASFIHRTAGSIADPGFRRHEQGEYEKRTELP
jgi:hypothetical protein